jgi:hypothetical protein
MTKREIDEKNEGRKSRDTVPLNSNDWMEKENFLILKFWSDLLYFTQNPYYQAKLYSLMEEKGKNLSIMKV